MSIATRAVLQRCSCGKSASDGECESCRRKRTALQRRPERETDRATAPREVHDVLRRPGRPLPDDVRIPAERRLGFDFSKVRIHTDEQAARSAALVNARAYAVANHVVFGRSRFSPQSTSGRRLLAHELAHVVQQRNVPYVPGSPLTIEPAGGTAEAEARAMSRNDTGAPESTGVAGGGVRLQRDLATPLPEEAPEAQPDLTPAQIRSAIAFNRSRFDEESTRVIQDLVGTEPTGTWTAADVVAIAEIQEEYGLEKDGMVGFEFFQWLSEEQRLEGAESDEDCLIGFRVIGLRPQTAVQSPPNCALAMRAHFRVEAQFAERCDCSQFEYRQFIRGSFTARRGTTTENLGHMFRFLPAGRLNASFQEDGNTQWTAVHYGHRDEPGQATTDAVNAENHYVDNDGQTDQENGCRFRGEDFPSVRIDSGCLSGDEFRLSLFFRGEIRRSGAVVDTRNWTGINQQVTIP